MHIKPDRCILWERSTVNLAIIDYYQKLLLSHYRKCKLSGNSKRMLFEDDFTLTNFIVGEYSCYNTAITRIERTSSMRAFLQHHSLVISIIRVLNLFLFWCRSGNNRTDTYCQNKKQKKFLHYCNNLFFAHASPGYVLHYQKRKCEAD